MDIGALRAGVAPKSHAPVRTIFVILEAPCLGKCSTGYDFFKLVQVLARKSHGASFLPKQLLPRANETAGQPVTEKPVVAQSISGLAL